MEEDLVLVPKSSGLRFLLNGLTFLGRVCNLKAQILLVGGVHILCVHREGRGILLVGVGRRTSRRRSNCVVASMRLCNVVLGLGHGRHVVELGVANVDNGEGR